ncbi:MAG: serine/threonine protein kinase [Chloroflexi bacterium CFX4]|nr:serine/threonine protein kinase [Chloroflexi bacterium CFX4]MDL1922406.1 serine/threonine protein kinase [Chloroflexi bacterium CFX3]
MSYNAGALVGRTVSKYEIVSVVGGGGMGTVYRARQVGVQRDVAVKVLNIELSDTEQFVTRFQREAENIAALEHPHIIPVIDFGREGDYVFLVMALKTGGNLSQIIRGTETPLSDVQRYIEQIASALDYAHLRGIIHRDLKPANILLDEDGNTFLTDFGIARRLGETKLTAPGTVVGSPTYMAPEAWRGEDPSAETDVYSLGIILFQLLTGKAPFEETKTARLMNMHLFDQPPLLRGLRPDLGEHFEMIMNLSLAKDRAQRFHTAGEMAKAVRTAVSAHKAPAPSAMPADSDKTMILQRTEPKPPVGRDQRVQEALQADALRVPMPSRPEIPAAPRGTGRSQPTPLGRAEPELAAAPRDNTRLLVIGMGVIILILLVAIIVLLLSR